MLRRLQRDLPQLSDESKLPILRTTSRLRLQSFLRISIYVLLGYMLRLWTGKNIVASPSQASVGTMSTVTSVSKCLSSDGHAGNQHRGRRSGVIVLGMHRSGTSMLTGLLAQAGLSLGRAVIGAQEENQKGYFELLPAVQQNEAFFASQNINWSWKTYSFDPYISLQKVLKDPKEFFYGQRAIDDLERRPPWVLKDPRMCATIRGWLPFFRDSPAVVFTYRHPLEASHSLLMRTVDLPTGKWKMKRLLRLWMQYNHQAVQNSQDLCRVITSNDRIMADPLKEMNDIITALRERCGVPVPYELTAKEVDQFVDMKLQHKTKDKLTAAGGGRLLPNGCLLPEPNWELPTIQRLKNLELEAYEEAMTVYCDLESGIAFDADYEWPAYKET